MSGTISGCICLFFFTRFKYNNRLVNNNCRCKRKSVFATSLLLKIVNSFYYKKLSTGIIVKFNAVHSASSAYFINVFIEKKIKKNRRHRLECVIIYSAGFSLFT